MIIIIVVLNLSVIGLLVYLGYKLRGRFLYLDRQFIGLQRNVNAKSEEYLNKVFNEKTQELLNAIAIQQLGFTYPLFLAGWSIDSFLGRSLVTHILDSNPKTILELGSGASTLLIARCLEQLGEYDVEHISVDHEEHYLALTEKSLIANNLGSKVDLWHCPLADNIVHGKLWYQGLTERLHGKKIDLLVVDGPPGRLQEQSRFPALPELLPFLSEECLVILDDTNRTDENIIAHKWAANNREFDVNFINQGHGHALLQRRTK